MEMDKIQENEEEFEKYNLNISFRCEKEKPSTCFQLNGNLNTVQDIKCVACHKIIKTGETAYNIDGVIDFGEGKFVSRTYYCYECVKRSDFVEVLGRRLNKEFNNCMSFFEGLKNEE